MKTTNHIPANTYEYQKRYRKVAPSRVIAKMLTESHNGAQIKRRDYFLPRDFGIKEASLKGGNHKPEKSGFIKKNEYLKG